MVGNHPARSASATSCFANCRGISRRCDSFWNLIAKALETKSLIKGSTPPSIGKFHLRLQKGRIYPLSRDRNIGTQYMNASPSATSKQSVFKVAPTPTRW